jgi:hydroxyacylglutathione hydrolase
MTICISAIPAFQDNYIWLITHGNHAAVVDPGDAVPVINYLKAHQLNLDAILITHHHADHIGGVDDLLKHYSAQVYAPQKEVYKFPHIAVADGQSVQLQHLNLSLQVMEIPGHTLGHVAYYGANSLFCGDTLFGGGCGRLFEGTPAQMLNSLQRIAALPQQTAIYCAHEYTEHNLQFAKTLEPNNQALIQRIAETRIIRAQGKPSLPSFLKLELETNPFLRCQLPQIAEKIGLRSNDTLAVFTAVRQLRNHF